MNKNKTYEAPELFHPDLNNARAAAVEVLADAQPVVEVDAVEESLAAYGQGRARAAGAEGAVVDQRTKPLRRARHGRVELFEAALHFDAHRRTENFSYVRHATRILPEYLILLVEAKLGKRDSSIHTLALRARLQVGEAPFADEARARPWRILCYDF